jgi:hypothetical protein
MCEAGQPPTPVAALAMLDAALDCLSRTDLAALPTALQADCLRALERAEAKHTAVRAGVLAAFGTQHGFEDDGQRAALPWLKWQTRVTGAAAAGALAWAKRLSAHPQVGRALAAGTVSTSWARAICSWTDQLSAAGRQAADEILLAAADGGAALADLAALAMEMRRRNAAPDTDPDDGFDDRNLRLGVTFGGAGRVEGDLTPGCTAALSAVLDALGKKAGPQDTRTARQRRHDALEEACRRLIASGMLPGRAGQPTQALVHMTLSQLRGLPGASAAETAWLRDRVARPGWLADEDAAGASCDATIVPVVTGQVDSAALDRMVQVFLAGPAGRDPAHGSWAPEELARLRGSLLAMAADVLSGPGGLASWLRTSLTDGPAGSPSLPLTITLPLDAGEAGPAIPGHLRRAVLTRHPGCEFPGCGQPGSVCQIHHIIPRSKGGPTALGNLTGLCTFHHLIVIHRWGWELRLNPDGSTTATSPDGRILHSHSPPGRAAAA